MPKKLLTAEQMEQSGKYNDYQSMMRAYAKMHVKAALEAAYLNGEIDFEEYGGGIEGGSINKKSILGAYPESKIK